MARRREGAGSRRDRTRERSARWSEAEARRRVEAWRASGLSLMAWCRREGLGYERVRRWRRALRGAERRRAAPQLLPVQLLESRECAFPFELELPRGVRLRVAPDFDAASLAQLLRVVEAGS